MYYIHIINYNNIYITIHIILLAKEFRDMIHSFESQSNSLVHDYLLLKSYVTQLNSSLILELQSLDILVTISNSPTNANRSIATNSSMNTIQEEIKKNEDMFILLIRNIRNKVTKLNTSITEYEAIKSIQENQLMEQLNHIENIQSQMNALVTSKQSLEQRHALEVSYYIVLTVI